MKITYALDPAGHGGIFNMANLDAHMHKYFQRMGVPPGVIYMSAPMYRDMIGTMYNNTPQYLPLSKEKRFLHLVTPYGILPVIPEFKNQAYELTFNVSEEFEREFEKIILGE